MELLEGEKATWRFDSRGGDMSGLVRMEVALTKPGAYSEFTDIQSLASGLSFRGEIQWDVYITPHVESVCEQRRYLFARRRLHGYTRPQVH